MNKKDLINKLIYILNMDDKEDMKLAIHTLISEIKVKNSEDNILMFTCYGGRGQGKSYMEHLKDQLQQKENIIKEIRKKLNWAYEEDEYQGAIYDIDQIIRKG